MSWRKFVSILVAGSALLVGGCSRTPTYPVPDLPADYQFVLTSSCGERPLNGKYLVTVTNGSVTRAQPVEAGTPQPDLRFVPTLRELVEKANQADGDAKVDLVTSDDGIPTSLHIDPSTDVVDDEECYQIADYEPLGRGRE